MCHQKAQSLGSRSSEPPSHVPRGELAAACDSFFRTAWFLLLGSYRLVFTAAEQSGLPSRAGPDQRNSSRRWLSVMRTPYRLR